jgi:hypothetical protein
MADASLEHGLTRHLPGREVLKLLAAQLGVPGLVADAEVAAAGPDKTYGSNEDLWKPLHRGLRAGSVVKLADFWLSEWFPLQPGLFHTLEARQRRDWAESALLVDERLQVPEDGMRVYDPNGKQAMLDGGVGSVRLKQHELAEGTVWFMGASSTPVAHEGIPVALPDALYATCIEQIAETGAMRCSIAGRLKFLPATFDPLFRAMVGVPQVYLAVEELKTVKGGQDTSFLATGAVMWEDTHASPTDVPLDPWQEPGWWDPLPGLHAAFVSFHPGERGSIERASEWLADAYIGELLGGRVLTDFDEQVRRFSGAIFSLETVMGGDISVAHLNRLLGRCEPPDGIKRIAVERIDNLHVGVAVVHESRSINIGAGAVVTAPTVIADSIQESFNRVEQSALDPSTAELLRDLAKAVVQVANEAPDPIAATMARDVETLTTELTSDAPRARWYQLALESLRETATTLGAVATPVLDIITKLGPLL